MSIDCKNGRHPHRADRLRPKCAQGRRRSALRVHCRDVSSACAASGAGRGGRDRRLPRPARSGTGPFRYLSVTDTDTGALVLPAESVAVTEIVWLPTAALRAFHFIE